MDLEIVRVAAAILIPFTILFLGTLIATINYFLKRFAEDIKRDFTKLELKIDENDAKVIQVEKDFIAFQVQLPKEYVLRADHLRVTAIFEKKVDRLGELIQALDGTIQGQQAQMKLLLIKFGEIDANAKK